MSTRQTLIASLVATLFTGVAFAASTAEPETPGSEAPKAVAEATHMARMHGIDNRAKQPLAEAPGSERAQAAAEARHLPLAHGNINDSADRRMLRDASRL